MTSEQLDVQMDHIFERLVVDLGGDVSAEHVLAVGASHFERLQRDAAINDFIPLLVYRFTREELVAAGRGDLHVAA
jgi:hypothetical protein